MSTAEISKAIENEVNGDWDRENPCGVILRTCLITPERRRFMDAGKDETIDLWVVLEEYPETHRGYMIVFDESSKRYGLAIVDQNKNGVFIGFYGTFLETLDAL